MKTAWITGAGGLIGRYLVETSARFHPVALTRAEIDLTDFEAVEKKFKAAPPALVIHCAALSKSPDCQAQPALARKINVSATAHLAALAADCGFIFFSTDLVFDGRQGNYLETDAVNPLSVYGETKVEAEQIVLRNPRHTVVRTSLNSGVSLKGSAYNEQLVESWRKGGTAKLFVDEFRCPIPAPVTAQATWELAAHGAAGLYHLAGSERLSREKIGRIAALRHPELEARIEPGSLRDYRGAPRAADTSLNCAKIKRLLSFPLPGLDRYLQEHPEEPF